MERKSNYTNGILKIGRILNKTTKKLERSYQINGNGKRSHEKTIRQEEIESTRTKRRG